MKLIKAMATVAGLTMLSRIAGFTRDILTAMFLGAGWVADAFFVALKLPNFFRRVTAEGAFSVSFVPLYAKKLEADKGADEFASEALSFMVVVLAVFTLVMLLAMPWIIQLIAPGFSSEIILEGATCIQAPCNEYADPRYPLAVDLSLITFPYLFLMSLTALLGGVLNARGKYGPFAAAPILFNLTLIGMMLAAPKSSYEIGYALAWGIFFAGLIQLAFMMIFIVRQKVRLRLRLPKLSADVKKLLKLMGPGIVGAGVVHINLFADMIIASFLGEGSISYLYYADRLNQLPLGVVGIAVGTALLPLLSKALVSEDKTEANGLYNRSLEYCFLLALPAAAALAVMPDILIKVLFERGAFSAEDTAITAMVLQAYAIGLPAYIAGKVFSTVYWANEDTVSPVKVSIKITILNIIFAIILSRFIGVVGIALSTGLVAWLQFVLLKRGLKEKSEAIIDVQFKTNFLKIVLATCFMAGVLFMMKFLLGETFENGTQIQTILALVALVISGLLSYGLAVTLSGAVSIKQIKSVLKKA